MNINILEKKQKRQEERGRLPFTIIREEVVDRNSFYGRNFFSKIKSVITYLDEKNGKSKRRKELEYRKQQDLTARLQVSCSRIFNSIYKRLRPEDNSISKSSEVVAQIDPKFHSVLNTVINSKQLDMDIRVKPINKNYERYTDKVPTVVEVKRVKSQL